MWVLEPCGKGSGERVMMTVGFYLHVSSNRSNVDERAQICGIATTRTKGRDVDNALFGGAQ